MIVYSKEMAGRQRERRKKNKKSQSSTRNKPNPNKQNGFVDTVYGTEYGVCFPRVVIRFIVLQGASSVMLMHP